jgi:hypothetical protein
MEHSGQKSPGFSDALKRPDEYFGSLKGREFVLTLKAEVFPPTQKDLLDEAE